MNVTGVVTALSAEARCLGPTRPRADGLLESGAGLLLALSGMGAAPAAAGARQLIAAGCTHLISFGMAGGLDPRLAAGEVVLPARVLRPDGQARECDAQWRQTLAERLRGPVRLSDPGAPVTLLSVDLPLLTPADKAAARMGGASAVDMESFAIASEAAVAGVPFIAVRVITDTAHDGLPPSVAAALDARGEVQLGRLLRNLVLRPRDLPALIALSRRFGAARRALRATARAGLGPAPQGGDGLPGRELKNGVGKP